MLIKGADMNNNTFDLYKDILNNMVFDENDLEPVDTEGHTYEGIAIYKGKEYFIHDYIFNPKTLHLTWQQTAAHEIYEQLVKENNNEQKHETL